MRIYNTKTQSDYDSLMLELEEQGFKWLSGDKPTCFGYWEYEKENSCVTISGKNITFGSIEGHKNWHSNIPIIEYKANKQGEK